MQASHLNLRQPISPAAPDEPPGTGERGRTTMTTACQAVPATTSATTSPTASVQESPAFVKARLEHLDPVDMAFDGGRVPEQGNVGDDAAAVDALGLPVNVPRQRSVEAISVSQRSRRARR
jgi:hypothetical protein